MQSFRELYQPAHTLIGNGSLREIPRYIRSIPGKKAFIVTDEDLVRLGTVRKVTDVLEQNGLEYIVFSGVKSNPTVSMVEEARGVYESNGCDYLIGIGGGSPMDVAKAVSILSANGGKVEDYNGLNRSFCAGAPLIAINTTAGSGSEVTRAYVITDEVRRAKMLMVDSNCLSFLAVDDPQLMMEMPPSVTASTGMDALTHAIEAYVSKSHTPYSDGLALEAIRLVWKSLAKAVEEGNNLEARTDMCWAEYMAGLAFSNAGLGMVHAMAHQLGGFYNMPHGTANAILLPYVMRFNLPECKRRYADVAAAMGISISDMSADQAAKLGIRRICELAVRIKIPRLKDTDFKLADAPVLALHAMEDTGMPENPRQPCVVDVQRVFSNAFFENKEG